MDLPAITGFGHVDLTVTDADRSVQWWEEVMGFKLITTSKRDRFQVLNVIHPSGFYVGLVQHEDRTSDQFDERSIGLDHLALRVPDRAALESWAERLDDLGIAHSGIQAEQGGPLITFRDPDNIQLELWAYDPNDVTPGSFNTEFHL